MTHLWCRRLGRSIASFCDATRQASKIGQIQIGGFEQILMILSQWCEKITTKDMHHLALDPGST
jgi:hypothetical protein